MNFDSMNKMNSWEREKAIYLMGIAESKLGMDLSGYGEIGVNQSYGNTYLWLEDYSFCLYMPICCELQESDVWVSWSDPYDGEEYEETLDEFVSLNAIEEWCAKLYEKSDEKECESDMENG